MSVLFLALMGCASGPDQGAPNPPRIASAEEIEAYFLALGKTVVTFAGYSGAGYEDPARMLAVAEAQLDQYSAAQTIVNIGATAEGIGAVYEIAHRRGFATTGIVSTQALDNQVPLSPAVDRVFYVQDESWGGVVAATGQLSPTSEAMVAASDVMIGIGGGDVARDEMLAARRMRKEVRFLPADMEHGKAIEAARRKGLPAPTDFRGSAHAAFAE